MENILKRSCLTVILVLVCASCSNRACAQEQENDQSNSLVGRISHIEGQLLRYVPDDDDWVLTEKDTPFGEYDLLFSSEDGKVEIIMPNNTLVRIGGDTQVQLIELTNEATEIDVSSGTARLYNRSSSTEIKVTTPFGDVVMPPQTRCDISVHDTQTELMSIKGSVEFIQSDSNAPQEVIAGSSSLIATSDQVSASAHSVSLEWDGWNVDRDVQWTQRMQARGESNKYLPESLQADASELDTNGSWERVNYEGRYNYFWRPSYVSAGWTPFSSGRWIAWHGEQTWVPYDSFGYVTHHYGNWVYASSRWYWAPPVSGLMVSAGLPLLNIGVGWYPGRVAWLSSSISIGWFPLAPYETYYSGRYWGPRSRVRHYNNYYRCDGRRYRHYKHARFIDHRRFHGSKNYRHAGLRKMKHGEKFRGSARIPEKMRRNFKTKNNHRYASNIPKYRGKVEKIDERRIKRLRQASGSKVNKNPFKRRVAKTAFNNRKAGKTIVKNTPRKVVKNNKQVQKRLNAVNKNLPKIRQGNKQKTNRLVKANTGKRKESLNKARRSLEQSSKKMAQNRQKVQKSAQGSRGTVSQKFSAKRQNKPNRNIVVKNTNSGTRSLSQRSGKTHMAKRSNNTGRMSNSYGRSGSQQRSRQNSTGRMQSYSARGRR